MEESSVQINSSRKSRREDTDVKPSIGVISFNAGGVNYCDYKKKGFTCKPSNFVIDASEYLAGAKSDICVVGLQESYATSSLSSAFKLAFKDLGYSFLYSESLVGIGKELIRNIVILIFVKDDSKFNVAIGQKGLSYRCAHQSKGKGAIGVLLNIKRNSKQAFTKQIYLFSVHLPFDDSRPDQALQDRLDCLNGILSKFEISGEKFKISGEKSLLLFGDLNFRIEPAKQIEGAIAAEIGPIATRKAQEKFEIDQFKKFLDGSKRTWLNDSVEDAREKGLKMIKTCKLKTGRSPQECKGNDYEDCYKVEDVKKQFGFFGKKKIKPRVPSFCDRIIYTNDLKLLDYRTIDTIGTSYSDHLLVTGVFDLTI